MNDVWYEEIPATERLMQGDLILDCPVVTWHEKLQLRETVEATLKATVNVIEVDVVVMTQACDLEYEHVSNVTLCPHLPLTEFRQEWEQQEREKGQNPTEKSWKATCDSLRDGYIWNMSLLNSGEADSLGTEHRVVDFYDVFTLPRDFVESFLLQRHGARLRLLPPYREHLSQAFARFYMRVGLPTPVIKAW